MGVTEAVTGLVVALAVTWVAAVAALVLLRPRGISVAAARRLVPDILRLVRALAADPVLPTGVRLRLAVLLAYLALPFDLVPDVIPVVGLADDVIVLALVLRSVVRRAGAAAVDRHWSGTQEGLSVVHALAGTGRR